MPLSKQSDFDLSTSTKINQENLEFLKSCVGLQKREEKDKKPRKPTGQAMEKPLNAIVELLKDGEISKETKKEVEETFTAGKVFVKELEKEVK